MEPWAGGNEWAVLPGWRWVPGGCPSVLGAGCRICRVVMEQGGESAGLGGRGFERFAGVSCNFLLIKMLQNSQLAFLNYYFIFCLDAEFLFVSEQGMEVVKLPPLLVRDLSLR